MTVTADVCLLLEGTYPFVRGGVSTWVHQIIGGLPEVTFALVFIGGRRKDYGESKYELPANVIHMETHYLEDALRDVRPRQVRFEGKRLEQVREFHHCLGATRVMSPENDAVINQMLASLDTRKGVKREDFLHGSGAWTYFRERYAAGHATTPFLDYFWTLRLMHGPVFQLAKIAEGVPSAGLYHTISTGFAGLLGAFLAARRKRPLLLSEHGIYTKERKIDLHRAEWIDAVRPRREVGGADETASIRALWIRYFEGMGRLTYRASKVIVSLYSGNRERQHEDGANPERTRVIVNGVKVERFAPALAARGDAIPLTVGLIGRVVPIKDVKSFVRAMRVAVSELPKLQGLIIGGSDEDPAYAAECVRMVESLGLTENVHFLGHQNVVEMFPKLGLLVLSSISEAQPLAILEGFASGVPCATTDVGACREQIEGLSPEDRALGLAGRVVPFADSEGLGHAIVELLSDPQEWKRCQQTGLKRVRTYYTEQVMLDTYRGLYREVAEA